MESWKRVLREGIFPQLSTAALTALEVALERDLPELMQWATTEPPPLQCMLDCAPEGGCFVGYAGWRGEGLQTIGEVQKYFAVVCKATDDALAETSACRHFLNWFDDTPRDVAFPLVLREVQIELADRISKGLLLAERRAPSVA